MMGLYLILSIGKINFAAKARPKSTIKFYIINNNSGFWINLGTSKVLDTRHRRSADNGTPQGETTEGNAVNDTLMVDQGRSKVLTQLSSADKI